jgi:cystathionine beta-lyase/cystathionine gamma-synthase
VRFSIGLEDPEDIKRELSQALDQVAAQMSFRV